MVSLHYLIVYQTFGFVEKDYNLIQLGGKNFRVPSAPGAMIDGNRSDGLAAAHKSVARKLPK